MPEAVDNGVQCVYDFALMLALLFYIQEIKVEGEGEEKP